MYYVAFSLLVVGMMLMMLDLFGVAPWAAGLANFVLLASLAMAATTAMARWAHHRHVTAHH